MTASAPAMSPPPAAPPMAAPDPAGPAGPAEHTIDDLAALTKVPSRTIRFYQGKGVLPRPELRGRVAIYGPAHVERLKLIASLQDRGLRIDTIRELVARIDKGELDVNEWLGLDAQLQGSWANEKARTVTEAELFEMVGENRPGLLSALLRARLVTRSGDTYLVKSPALLHIAGKLQAAGIDLELSREAGDILRKHLAKAAGELAEHFFDHAHEGFGRSATVEDLAAAFQAVRPQGLEAVRVIFAQEMERVLRKKAESGDAVKLQARAKKKAKG
jgi:DNA-binding transcriptional MerR regulator